MISVSEAKKIIQEAVHSLPVIQCGLNDSAGFYLAGDLYAHTDIPGFNQSSIDGYAFAFDEWHQNKLLSIHSVIPAGHSEIVSHLPKHAYRIFTGAPVPSGTDTVVLQEKCKVDNNHLQIHDEQLTKGNAVRKKGSEIKASELALEKGVLLTPAAIGFLANIGITEVPITAKPKISIIITGNELQQPGHVLTHGQVYESNSFALVAAIHQQSLKDVTVFRANDQLEQLIEILEHCLSESDLILFTGGVSVGDYDFVIKATTACGIKQLFHKVKQKPGKPLYFGMKGHQVIFGLPGNPSSVLTCFYEYVLPALHLLNNSIKVLNVMHAPLVNTYQKVPGLSHFLKGYYDGNKVNILEAQESYRLHSFAKANCLIFIDEDTTICKEGEIAEIHLLNK